MDTFELMVRNSVEMVTEDEVRALADSPAGRRVYVGYEPSGVLHLGHMLTANKLIDLQECGFEVVILLADVHAYLNKKGSFAEIRETAAQMQEQFVAYGLDDESTEFVLGSSYQLAENYVLDLHSLALETTLSRAQRAMAEIQGDAVPNVSHVVYPLMQALDIEYLSLDLAVGGIDQRKVHMLARDNLPSIGYDSRPAIHTPILADLETGVGKMSSSAGVTISMEDTRETISSKVTEAFCPPTADPDPDEEGNDRENPVLQLFRYHVFPRFEEVRVERPEKYGGNVSFTACSSFESAVESGELHPADAKSTLVEYLDRLIAPGRQKLREA